MILGAILLLFLASVIHSWYSANAAASETAARGEVAIGFIMFGRGVLAFSVVLLIIGLVLLWIATGFPGVIVGAAAYFLVLPLVTLPLLTALNLIPRRD